MTNKEQESELLRKLRGHMAYKKQVPPYNVFRDEELERLLESRPKTIEELGQIKGFPIDGKRVAGYGNAIITIFNNADKIEEFDVALDSDGEPKVTTVLKKLNLF